jgi:hypothetical protein
VIFCNQNASSDPFWKPTLSLSAIRRFTRACILIAENHWSPASRGSGYLEIVLLSEAAPSRLHLIKQSQGILIPATPETSDFLQSKCKLGSVLETFSGGALLSGGWLFRPALQV